MQHGRDRSEEPPPKSLAFRRRRHRALAYRREAMDYLDFLSRVHERLAPPNYLEIGIRFGNSLELARSPSIGIDPAYELRSKLREDAALFRETSDDYFARADAMEPFGGSPAALSFIDGMHLAEYALRDFINVERRSAWSSVVVFDDILPREVEEANRERTTKAWAGDVFKVLGILERHRPDLICLRIDAEPTGLMLVLGLDPDDQTLDKRYDRIADDVVKPDPQDVPDDLLERRDVLDPEAVLGASFWDVLRDAQTGGTERKDGMRALRKALKSDFGRRVSRRRLRAVLPLPA